MFSLLKTYNSFTTDRGFRSNKSLNLLNLKKMLESFKWFYIVLVAGFCWDVLYLHLFGVVWWLLHDNETMGKTLFCCLFILNISLYIQNINGKKQQILFIPYFCLSISLIITFKNERNQSQVRKLERNLIDYNYELHVFLFLFLFSNSCWGELSSQEVMEMNQKTKELNPIV